jgi:hypothetical protein
MLLFPGSGGRMILKVADLGTMVSVTESFHKFMRGNSFSWAPEVCDSLFDLLVINK